MLAVLPSTQWLTLHGLATALAVLFYVVNSHVMPQRRPPASAIAWILFIVALPYLALPTFLLFGSRKLARPSAITQRAGLDPAHPETGPDSWAIETILALSQPAPAAYSALNIHADGAAARTALLATIDAAVSSIDLCTFILADDPLGRTVVEHLCASAERGVRVRLLLDGVGRLMAGRPSVERLVAAGGEVALFVPPWHSPLKGRSNLRDHRKLLIADAGTARGRLWCGGRNLANAYFEGQPGQAPWRDLSFDLRGPVIAQAEALFEKDWAFAGGTTVGALPPAQAETPGDGSTRKGAQLVASGPDQADDTVHALLVTAAYRARKRIVLATPYFVPESALLMALCLAARRGVMVDLLLPAHSNHRLSDWARGRALRALALAGGRIWLAPEMVHAKLAVFDDVLALAGSANLDSRSLFLNYELMLAFHASDDVCRFTTWFDAERLPARSFVAKAPGLLRDIAEGMLLWLAFQL